MDPFFSWKCCIFRKSWVDENWRPFEGKLTEYVNGGGPAQSSTRDLRECMWDYGKRHLVTKMALSIFFLFWTLLGLSSGSLTQSRLQNRHLQRVINHNRVSIVLEGVRSRALNSVKPDPILLINFPEVDHQFKVIFPTKIVFDKVWNRFQNDFCFVHTVPFYV